MSEMSPAEVIFLAAASLPPAARPAYLARVCAGQDELRQRVERMLAVQPGIGDLVEPADATPAGPAALPTADVPDPGTASFDPDGTRTAATDPVGAAGQLIAGRYKLLEPVGEGGMGSVWMAEQRQPVKRLVAIKLIKAGMDSKGVLARFDAERQALAVMDHPNIAKVLDGGLDADGRPYFVMELVKGTPITAFADARRLSPRERLELFVPVCSAIQHAHMKGVIHRDIKPSNVLVGLYDDKAVPKVIDFGIAKATGQALTDHTLNTGFGAVVGTPEYMSPEQASLNNLDIDTRSDVYSLGVLLYELLAGSPPFTKRELGMVGLLEMLRVVRETEPQRPSAKLSTAAAKPTIAAARGLEPAALGRVLRSELDWVVMRALEKDRNRRYESANSLAADVQRYLAGEQVQAVPPSVGYRMRKWVRKNRGLVTASGLVAVSLLVGTGVATWQAVRAEREAERARGEEQKVRDEQTKTQAALEQSERTLVHSFLRPLGYNTTGFDQAELVALDELARQDDDHIKLLFLQQALADGERALRAARRAERVVQAAVGTSPKRRAAALELAAEKQRDKSADPRVRLCACLLAVELGSDDLPALGECFDTLSARKVTDWDTFVGQLPARIQPTMETALAEALVEVLRRPTDTNAMTAAGSGLVALAPRLNPATANRVADAVIGVLNKQNDSAALTAATNGLTALAPLLDPPTTTRSMDALAAVYVRATDGTVQQVVANGLAALAPRLDPASVGRLTDALLAYVGKVTDPNAQSSGGDNWLTTLSPHLDPLNAGRVSDALVAALGKATDQHALWVVGSGLAAIAPRLDPVGAAKAADALVAALAKAKEPSTPPAALGGPGVPPLSSTSEVAEYGLAALAPRLDAVATGRAADALVRVLDKATDPQVLSTAVVALVALAPRLDPAGAAKAADALVAALAKAKEPSIPFENGLAALAPRLDAVAAGRAADALVRVLDKATDPQVLSTAVVALVALAPRLDPAGAAKAADALVAALAKAKDPPAMALPPGGRPGGFGPLGGGMGGPTQEPSTRQTASNGLATLSSRLDPAGATKAADALLEVIGQSMEVGTVQAAVNALAALAPRLDATTAGRVADALVGALGKGTASTAVAVANSGTETGGPGGGVGNNSLPTAVGVFAALAPRLDPAGATRLADALTTVLARATDSVVSKAAGRGLVAVAPRLDPARAQGKFDQLVDTLVGALGKATDRNLLRTPGSNPSALLAAAAKGLEAIAPQLDVTAATRAALALVAAMRDKLADVDDLTGLGDSLAALAPRLDAAAAMRLAEALVAVLNKANEPNAFPVATSGMTAPQAAGNGLVALVPRLDAAGATRLAGALVGVYTKATDAILWTAAGSGLAALAPSLDPATAAKCADSLTTALASPDDPNKTGAVSQTLVILAGVLRPRQRETLGERASFQLLATDRVAAANIIDNSMMGGSNRTINSIPEFGQLLDPVSSLPFLTDLLRDPGCVGAMRDSVLYRLEELAYPDLVQAAAFVGLASDPLRPLTLGALKSDADGKRQQNRRFRTASDAARWLAEHHPEIDLERPYHLTTPGK